MKKGLGSYVKSYRHYFNICRMLVRELGFDEIGEDTEDHLKELYSLSQDIDYDCREFDIKNPALWFTYQLRECDTKEEVLNLVSLLEQLLIDTYEFQQNKNPEVFSDYEDFLWEEV